MRNDMYKELDLKLNELTSGKYRLGMFDTRIMVINTFDSAGELRIYNGIDMLSALFLEVAGSNKNIEHILGSRLPCTLEDIKSVNEDEFDLEEPVPLISMYDDVTGVTVAEDKKKGDIDITPFA